MEHGRYDYKETHLRTATDQDGKAWFLMEDVCRILGIDEEASRALDASESVTSS